MLCVGEKTSKSISVNEALFSSVILLLVTGAGYRVMAHHLGLLTNTTMLLPVPLEEFPSEVSGWVSEDIPVPSYIEQVLDNNDLLYRTFSNYPTGQWVNAYVSYSGNSRVMLGHRPRVCYVADGWIHERTITSHFISAKGRKIPCLVHRFYKDVYDYKEVVVLNFYVSNGQVSRSEKDFLGMGWRAPNVSNDLKRYMAQVQISSELHSSVIAAARDLADSILDFFPDKKGIIAAEKHLRPSDDILN